MAAAAKTGMSSAVVAVLEVVPVNKVAATQIRRISASMGIPVIAASNSPIDSLTPELTKHSARQIPPANSRSTPQGMVLARSQVGRRSRPCRPVRGTATRSPAGPPARHWPWVTPKPPAHPLGKTDGLAGGLLEHLREIRLGGVPIGVPTPPMLAAKAIPSSRSSGGASSALSSVPSSTASAMGSSKRAVAVLEIHMLSVAETVMKPVTSLRTQPAPHGFTRPMATRRRAPEFSMAYDNRNPPSSRRINRNRRPRRHPQESTPRAGGISPVAGAR